MCCGFIALTEEEAAVTEWTFSHHHIVADEKKRNVVSVFALALWVLKKRNWCPFGCDKASVVRAYSVSVQC